MRRIPAIPARITIARIGSERASTSTSSSSWSATKTSVGCVRMRGTSRHQRRTCACASSEPLSASASAITPGLRRLLAHPASVARLGSAAARSACETDGVTTIVCPTCSAENEEGRKFCGECGSALARACPSCGTANAPTMKFCGECGSALGAATSAPVSAPTAERRLVTVLFADLVGFTSASAGTRRGGHPRAPDPLLRHLAHDHRALRRHRREVHRRRRHGCLGRAHCQRGRRRARRASGARARRVDAGTRSRPSGTRLGCSRGRRR